jgi:hypothetical protein
MKIATNSSIEVSSASFDSSTASSGGQWVLSQYSVQQVPGWIVISGELQRAEPKNAFLRVLPYYGIAGLTLLLVIGLAVAIAAWRGLVFPEATDEEELRLPAVEADKAVLAPGEAHDLEDGLAKVNSDLAKEATA